MLCNVLVFSHGSYQLWFQEEAIVYRDKGFNEQAVQ